MTHIPASPAPRADTVGNLPTYRWMKDYRSDWNFQGFDPWDFTIVLLTCLVYLRRSPSFKRWVSNSPARAFEQCHHFPSPYISLRYLRRAHSFCRILCFNIAITVIIPPPSPLYVARTPVHSERTFARGKVLRSLRKPYTCEIPIQSAHGYPRFPTPR